MPGIKKFNLKIIGKIIIYLGMNPEMKDNAMGGGRDGAKQASLEPLNIRWKKVNIGKFERVKQYIKY
jgi:hypothetical protein